MSHPQPGWWALWLSFPIGVLLMGVSVGGSLLPSVYANETPIRGAQYAGNDVGNFAIIVPILIIAAIMALRGSPAAHLVWMGSLVYVIYDFLGYALALHFTSLFLAYCAILGLSFYALAGTLLELPIAEVARRYSARTPVKTIAGVLLLMGAAIVFHWLGPIIPAMFTGKPPQSILHSGGVLEPVVVMDLAFGAPACAIAAIALLRHKPMGFILGPIVLTFLTLSSVVLAPMGIKMARGGFEGGRALCAIGLGIAAVGVVLLALSLRGPGSPFSVRSAKD